MPKLTETFAKKLAHARARTDKHWDAEIKGLKRFALNLNHLTLPKIINFNALGDESCLKLKSKRFKATP